jgi:anaerobic selenocysteine-containing dehydrogenase
VSGYPEATSELPAAALAEEIDTPGEGEIKALITIAGNPVLSAPNGQRLSKALEGIGFMVSVDPYVNETTRHADVILPPPPPSQTAHFDLALANVTTRNNARYSPPVRPREDGRPDEPEMLSRLAMILYGAGPDADPSLADEQVIAATLAKEANDPQSPVAGRGVEELTAQLPEGPGYERRIDMMLRLGPYGDGFGADPDGLTLDKLKAAPHGIDYGPLKPRIPEVLRTASGTAELAPAAVVDDVERLRGSLDRAADTFLLIGRRHLRSNNSWMHNLPALRGGTNRCTLQIHPNDAKRLGLKDFALVTGPGGQVRAPVEITDAIRPGVVCLPHGWGHDQPDTGQRTASRDPGVNVNSLYDGGLLDPLSSTSVLNGMPVEVLAAD